LKKITKKIFFNNIGLTCNFAKVLSQNNALRRHYKRSLDASYFIQIYHFSKSRIHLPQEQGKLLAIGFDWLCFADSTALDTCRLPKIERGLPALRATA